MTVPKKRISNRRHPDKKCKHCDMVFSPTDGKQVFYDPQHRIDYFNDLRKTKDAPLKALNARHLKNEQILKKIFEAMARLGQDSINLDILTYEGFDFDINTSTTVNKKSGAFIYWSFSYGIEGYNNIKESFKIWKK